MKYFTRWDNTKPVDLDPEWSCSWRERVGQSVGGILHHQIHPSSWTFSSAGTALQMHWAAALQRPIHTHSPPFTPGLCPRSPGLGSVGAFAPIATNLLQEKGLEHCFECDLWDQMEWFRVSFYLLVMYHWANYLISLSLSFFHYLGQHYQLGWLQGWLWCL